MEKVSINHIAEQFLYEYYCRPEAYDFEDGRELEALLAQAEEAERRAAESAGQTLHEEGPALREEAGAGSSAACEALKTAAVLRRQACDCYRMVYDLTGERKLAERIRRLS
ncbi:hypothetical protein [Lachnoclostridium sp. Marseille-P6806]|uniref:hypothetical protein n=1 Tax=Lachnoclostridium sp. Marseille-P6806 TaxID=2364793 RepID=UPI00103253DD|nr:hypothetical protein [Lachnoclostridium sp. Marseille-P6806]